MPNRIIKESICTSDNIDKLSLFQEVMFYRLIVNCDDYGRMDARPSILKAKLFPLKNYRNDQIEDALRTLSSMELVILYTVGGKPFLQMTTWDRHQTVRAKKSKYPSPQQADENSCDQMISPESDCARDPIQSESTPQRAETSSAADMFERFWHAYPKKQGKGAAEKAFRNINPSEELTDRMISAVDKARASDQWRRENGRFIPNPSTWLNQKRWEDEPESASGPAADDRGLKDWGIWRE